VSILKQAYHAIDMGQSAAENLIHRLNGKPQNDFRPSEKPMLIAFGDLDTFLVSGSTVVSSPLLAAAKEAVYQLTMARLDPPAGGGAICRVQDRAGQVLARLLPPRSYVCSDPARTLSVRIEAI
jgi:hypothetical protein